VTEQDQEYKNIFINVEGKFSLLYCEFKLTKSNYELRNLIVLMRENVALGLVESEVANQNSHTFDK
jgi:hypothetical protein